MPLGRAEKIINKEVFFVKHDEIDSKGRFTTLLKLHRPLAHLPLEQLISLF